MKVKKRYIETIYFLLILIVWTVFCCITMYDNDNTAEVGLGINHYFSALSLIIMLPYLVFTWETLLQKKSHGKLLACWTLFYLFTIPITILYAHGNFNGRIATIINWINPFIGMLVSYVFVRRNGISERMIFCFFISLLVMVIAYSQLYAIANEVNEAHIGTAYYPLFLLPIVLLHPSKWIRYVSIFIVLLVILSSLKRGGLLAMILALLGYIFAYSRTGVKNRFFKIFVILFAIVAVGGAIFYFDANYESSILDRFANIQDDGGSGRDQVWLHTWQMIQNSKGLDYLFGHGFCTVILTHPLGFSAHNDWLEVWYDYGIVGLLLMFVMFLVWCKYTLKLYKQKHQTAPAMVFLMVIFTVLTMISHVVIFQWMLLVCICLGGFIALKDRECNE